jgi:hypothetical protein
VVADGDRPFADGRFSREPDCRTTAMASSVLPASKHSLIASKLKRSSRSSNLDGKTKALKMPGELEPG